MQSQGQSLFDEGSPAGDMRPVADEEQRTVPVRAADPVRKPAGHLDECDCWGCLQAAGLVPFGPAKSVRTDMDRYADPNGE